MRTKLDSGIRTFTMKRRCSTLDGVEEKSCPRVATIVDNCGEENDCCENFSQLTQSAFLASNEAK